MSEQASTTDANAGRSFELDCSHVAKDEGKSRSLTRRGLHFRTARRLFGRPVAASRRFNGIGSVSVFPQINTAGDGGSYSIYDSTGISPAGADWFTLLSAFLAASP